MNTRIVMSSCAAALVASTAVVTGQTATRAPSPVTLVGCVQPQSARNARPEPSHEFVLIETRRAVDTSAAVSDSNETDAFPAAVGTSGTTSIYSLSGHAAELRRLSGKNVEIVGAMTAATKGQRTFTVISVREVPGICDAP
jgi:hypothetical protein